MDSGEISAAVALIGGILTALGAGDAVPFVGPAVQGILAIVSLGAALWSWYIHRQKNATISATASGLPR